MGMEGFATLYMRVPMSAATLPVQGQCSVDGKTLNLKFPFSSIGIELNSIPEKEQGKQNFKVKMGESGKTMTFTFRYIEDLNCFTGEGINEGEEKLSVSFCFFPEDSPMCRLQDKYDD